MNDNLITELTNMLTDRPEVKEFYVKPNGSAIPDVCYRRQMAAGKVTTSGGDEVEIDRFYEFKGKVSSVEELKYMLDNNRPRYD